MTDCMCRGCYAGSGASLHYIPKDPEIRQKWVDFIYKNRTAPKLKNLNRIRICSAHFTEECFTNYRQKMMGFGKRLILKPNAVPTIAVQMEFSAPSRTLQEKTEETTSETRLCPLCQRRQKDIDALAVHLTKKHSVHPACLDNLLITAPYANRSSGFIQEFSAQNVSKFTQQMVSESTKSSLMSDRENQETGEVTRGSSYGDTEALVRSDKPDNKSTAAAADGIVNPTFKCEICQESFHHKLELSVHYNSATHIQKIRPGTGCNRDSSTPAVAYPYVSTKPYQCDVCHVSYFYAFGLESHLKSVLHQSRTRKAGRVATNSKATGTVVTNLAGNATQIASATTCNFVPQAEKFQLQPASSLLPTPVVSAQTMPTVLPLITLAPNSVPHTIVPSVFPAPGTSTTQLIPQPQMLMPVLVNGLQTQSATPDSPRQILQQAVPVLGLCSTQQAQGLASSDSQIESAATGVSSVSRIPLETNATADAVGVQVKIEIKQEPCDQEVLEVTPCRADAFTQVDLKEEYMSMWDGLQDSVVCCDEQQSKSKEKSKRQNSDLNNASITQELHRSPCSSLSYGPPVLTEFQSQVLWAFFESRNEADSEIMPKEDCEALSREVGLTEEEIRKWLVDTLCTKDRHRADQRERRGSAEDEEDEGALMIDESGGTVLCSTTNFLSDEEDVDDGQITVDKKRKRGMDKQDSEEEAGGTQCRSYS